MSIGSKPYKPPKIKDRFFVGPDGVYHHGDYNEVNKHYPPGKQIHLEVIRLMGTTESGQTVELDRLIYNVDAEAWRLEPRGHECGPSSAECLYREYQAKIKEYADFIADGILKDGMSVDDFAAVRVLKDKVSRLKLTEEQIDAIQPDPQEAFKGRPKNEPPR
jgi:hypothetical protein